MGACFSHNIWAPNGFLSITHPTFKNSSKLPFKFPYQFIALGTLVQVSRFLTGSAWIHLYSRFQGDCPEIRWQPNFSDGFKKSHWFSVWAAFSCCKFQNNNFQVPCISVLNLEVPITIFKYIFVYFKYIKLFFASSNLIIYILFVILYDYETYNLVIIDSWVLNSSAFQD